MGRAPQHAINCSWCFCINPLSYQLSVSNFGLISSPQTILVVLSSLITHTIGVRTAQVIPHSGTDSGTGVLRMQALAPQHSLPLLINTPPPLLATENSNRGSSRMLVSTENGGQEEMITYFLPMGAVSNHIAIAIDGCWWDPIATENEDWAFISTAN